MHYNVCNKYRIFKQKLKYYIFLKKALGLSIVFSK